MRKKKIIITILVLIFVLSMLKQQTRPQNNIENKLVNTKTSTNSSKDDTFSLTQDKITRTYSVHTPPNVNENSKLPLLIVFHGGASNIDETKQTLGWDKTADSKGFLVAYPLGMGNVFFGKYLGTWNAGRCCEPAVKNKIDDLRFIKTMLGNIEKDFPVDTKRIYLTGISNGSMMAITTACQMSDQVAAIGTVAGPGEYDQCPLTKPVPLIYFHGTADQCAPYNGGITQGCYDTFFKEILGFPITGDKINFDSAQDFVSKWKNLNNTNATSKVIYQKNSALCTSSGYQTPSEVVFCKIVGMGHTWPGQLNYGPSCDKGLNDVGCKATMKILGNINNDISANEMMWNFFAQHSL